VHSVGPDLARGYSPRGAVACYAWPTERLAGPWPGGPVRQRRDPLHGNGVRAPGVLAARSPRTAHARDCAVARLPAASRWQGVADELAGAQGGRRARRSGVELTRAAARRRGGGGCFGRWMTSTVWPCSVGVGGRS
jgi:hypothetical protein